MKHGNRLCPECAQELADAARERDREDYLQELDEINDKANPEIWK